MPNNNLTLTVVVNGTPESVEVDIHEPVHTIIPRALEHHPGRPPQDWELKDANGALLDLNRKIEDYNFTTETRLFLSLKAGVAG